MNLTSSIRYAGLQLNNWTLELAVQFLQALKYAYLDPWAGLSLNARAHVEALDPCVNIFAVKGAADVLFKARKRNDGCSGVYAWTQPAWILTRAISSAGLLLEQDGLVGFLYVALQPRHPSLLRLIFEYSAIVCSHRSLLFSA